MTTQTDQFTGIAQRSVDATTTAIRSWTETLQSYTSTFSAENPAPRPADVHAVVDTWFELSAALLAEQRAFASALVEAGVEASGTIAEQARSASTTLPFRPVDAAGATA